MAYQINFVIVVADLTVYSEPTICTLATLSASDENPVVRISSLNIFGFIPHLLERFLIKVSIELWQIPCFLNTPFSRNEKIDLRERACPGVVYWLLVCVSFVQFHLKMTSERFDLESSVLYLCRQNHHHEAVDVLVSQLA